MSRKHASFLHCEKQMLQFLTWLAPPSTRKDIVHNVKNVYKSISLLNSLEHCIDTTGLRTAGHSWIGTRYLHVMSHIRTDGTLNDGHK